MNIVLDDAEEVYLKTGKRNKIGTVCSFVLLTSPRAYFAQRRQHNFDDEHRQINRIKQLYVSLYTCLVLIKQTHLLFICTLHVYAWIG